jgi:hypothetical protein
MNYFCGLPEVIKSGNNLVSDWFDAILKWQKFTVGAALPPVIVFGGEGGNERQGCRVVRWRELSGLGSNVVLRLLWL